ncbi:5'-methylthioadenosine/S-adenosylhomocysteinenucleosidase [Paenibacillus polymyxa]|nr:5'-methylthioadenosine/S-adenosylhomocysteinenucleosidase [Paenibacillus polymyxa]
MSALFFQIRMVICLNYQFSYLLNLAVSLKKRHRALFLSTFFEHRLEKQYDKKAYYLNLKGNQPMEHTTSDGRILVMTAVEGEREAVLRGLKGDTRFVVELAGVGAPSAAASTALALATGGYRLVISAGIGGGFVKVAALESVVVADAIIAADLGAETAEGFSSVDELGFGSSRIAVNAATAQRFVQALRDAGQTAVAGPILTVSTATGTAATAERLAKRVPGAAAEAMEGYGVAVAANRFELPMMEIRTISNTVGPRDRASWRIKEALQALEAAFSTLTEVI